MMCSSCKGAYNRLRAELMALNKALTSVEGVLQSSGCNIDYSVFNNDGTGTAVSGKGLEGAIAASSDLIVSGKPIDRATHYGHQSGTDKGVMQDLMDDFDSVSKDLKAKRDEIKEKMDEYSNCTHWMEENEESSTK